MIETVIRRTVDPKYRFTTSGQAALYIERGLAKLPGLFGVAEMEESRVVDYIVYQLYRSREAIGDGRWKYNWLFSDNSLDKFAKQFISGKGKSGMNYYIDQWLDEAELSRNDLTAMISKPKPSPLRNMVYMPAEEPIKRRFHNTIDGLMLCQSSTTGWSPLSAACGECSNWVECGKMTARKYPELMRYRKQEYGKQKE